MRTQNNKERSKSKEKRNNPPRSQNGLPRTKFLLGKVTHNSSCWAFWQGAVLRAGRIRGLTVVFALRCASSTGAGAPMNHGVLFFQRRHIEHSFRNLFGCRGVDCRVAVTHGQNNWRKKTDSACFGSCHRCRTALYRTSSRSACHCVAYHIPGLDADELCAMFTFLKC